MARRPKERLKTTWMAKRFDGSGVVKLQCSEGVYTSLKLENLPVPAELGEVTDSGMMMVRPISGIGTDGVRYRVIWPEPTPGAGRKYRTSSFCLCRAHVNETLYVFAEFLRDQGVEFVKLANKHGNGFSDVRLSGPQLAYLTRTIPHSPACHVDFFLADPPETGGTAGRVIGNATLDR